MEEKKCVGCNQLTSTIAVELLGPIIKPERLKGACGVAVPRATLNPASRARETGVIDMEKLFASATDGDNDDEDDDEDDIPTDAAGKKKNPEVNYKTPGKGRVFPTGERLLAVLCCAVRQC